MSRLVSCFAILLVVGIGFCISAQPALAANTVSSSAYLDNNSDGRVERIRWTLDENVTACVYEAGDWTVNTASEMNLIITGLSCTGTDAYLYITFNADANETGAATAPVLSYADVVTPGSVTLTSGAMSLKTSVSTTDAALPVLSAVSVTNYTGGGLTLNSFLFTYTEAMQISNGGSFETASTVLGNANLGAMTSARLLANLVSWELTNGGDMVDGISTGNSVIVSTNTVRVVMNDGAAAYFSAGSTAPTTALFTGVANATYVKDLADNGVNAFAAGVSATVANAWDVTAPTLVSVYSCNTDTDADIDRIQLNFSESMFDSALGASSFEGDNDTTNNDVGEETPSSFSTETAGCDLAASDTDANDEKVRVDFTAGIAGTDVAYISVITGSVVRDWAGNRVVVGTGLGTELDNAAPLLSSASPASGSGLPRSSPITLVFTEPVATDTFTPTLSSFSAGFSTAWSGGNTTAVLTPLGVYTQGSVTLTLTAFDASADENALGGAVTGGTHPVAYTVSGGSSATIEPETYALTIQSP
ncbi:MAG: hypothetical protein NUV56_02720, partial [Candidatus Uhrbacteria bacterium]|nr:hypothetical protein [Candidatus Uhrbacteria bacterium]